MQKTIALFFCALLCGHAKAQHSFNAIIKNKISGAALPGTHIIFSFKKTGAVSNINGFVSLHNIPAGMQLVTFSHTGFETVQDSFFFPVAADTFDILLTPQEEELDEVLVQSTRTGRTIKNTATRVEIIDGEELDEKNNMRPANVSMLLHESTGLQVQQTSATSGNASIRVQGLDGRYTQLLKDGYPNFGNFAGGLSILEIPPLDLKQLEVIKGPSSTLYGAGAIAGVVNFISKTPGEKREGDFIFNQSNIGQTNLGGYISGRNKKFGYAVLGAVNFQKAYDVDDDDFSEIPESNNFNINPRLFFYPDSSTTFMLGNSFSRTSNTGGDMKVIKNKADSFHTYFEKNKTIRNTTTLEFNKKISEQRKLSFKQSLAIFDRHILIPGYNFSGLNTNSFTDISYSKTKKTHLLIGGLNVVFDKFKQEQTGNLNAQSFTTGAYIQDTWDATERIIIESGIRADYVKYKNNLFSKSQAFLLPRVSALFKISEKISSRTSAGMGYKIPTIFTEQTESLQYQNLLPLNNVTAEKSIGGTADINYKTKILPQLSFSINQLFFITRINKPLLLQQDGSDNYYFSNAAKPVTSKGFETNLKFIYKQDLKLFAGYTFTDARAEYITGNRFLTLLPKNKVNLTLMYEKEDNFKLGLEGYFTDRQYLSNGFRTASYWEFGFMAQKTFNKISVFINFENFTDERQSNYKGVANAPHNNPSFDEIWNHTEGFVVNGGIKLKW